MIDIQKYVNALNKLLGADNAYYAGVEEVDAIVEIIKIAKDFEETIATLQAENESLKRQLDNSKLHQKETYKALQDEKSLRFNEDFIKAEAYKECIEKVKEKAESISSGYVLIAEMRLDEISKEMVGETDETSKN